MNKILVFLIVASILGITSVGILGNDIGLDVQLYKSWDDTDEMDEFSCECDPNISQVECDALPLCSP